MQRFSASELNHPISHSTPPLLRSLTYQPTLLKHRIWHCLTSPLFPSTGGAPIWSRASDHHTRLARLAQVLRFRSRVLLPRSSAPPPQQQPCPLIVDTCSLRVHLTLPPSTCLMPETHTLNSVLESQNAYPWVHSLHEPSRISNTHVLLLFMPLALLTLLHSLTSVIKSRTHHLVQSHVTPPHACRHLCLCLSSDSSSGLSLRHFRLIVRNHSVTQTIHGWCQRVLLKLFFVHDFECGGH